MRTVRIYQPTKLFADLTVILTPEAANHLVRVLRFEVNDQFTVFNGDGGEYLAKIIEIKKQQVVIHIESYKNHSVESPLKIHLGQAISRNEKMDFTIQKAVELGVTAITPLTTERCGVKLSADRWEKKLQHWQGVITSACEQSGRNFIPTIYPPMVLSQWLARSQADLKMILHPVGTKKIHDLKNHPQSIDLLVGPEGGFDELEINMAQQHQFISLQLGPRILRTETAALVAITTMQCLWGDL